MCAALVAASNDVCIMSDGYCCKVHDFGNRELNIGVSRVTFMTGKKTMFTSYIYLSHNTQPSMIHKFKISVYLGLSVQCQELRSHGPITEQLIG